MNRVSRNFLDSGNLLLVRIGSISLTLILAALVGLLSPARSMAATSTTAPETSHDVDRSTLGAMSPSVLEFTSSPTDDQFLRTGLFPEPLAPVHITSPEENRDLARAVMAYRDASERAGARDAVGPLLSFLSSHPNSAWKPALQLNLGLLYRASGHFSEALAIWQRGWKDSKDLTSRDGRDIANDMVAELSQLEAYLGRKELLRPLLASIKDRPVGGTPAQLLTDSRTGLYEMIHQPGSSFRCGPLALARILTYRGAGASGHSLQVVSDAQSTSHGLSLTMVEHIARQAGMHYQMAYRTPGSAVIVPAVVNWKVGHYAALVAKARSGYLIQDTTFGRDIRISGPTLDEEASGYYLVPAGKLPPGWRPVSSTEGNKVWGRGDTGTNHDTSATDLSATPPQNCPTCTCPSGGCTTWNVELEVVGLQLHDRPVGYNPPVGPAVQFDLYYSHRDTQQPSTFSYTNFGPKWTFTWLSYVTDDVNSTASATVYLRGGGAEPFTFSGTGATSSYPGPYNQASLIRTVSGGSSTTFTLTFPDGSFEQFNKAVGNQFFMTAMGDAQGNKVTLTYDSEMRIVSITDAVGEVTTLTYGLSSSPLLVTKITDPFGRSASFAYNSSGQLASITDVLGITSSYTYGQGTDPDFINTLTTPYGETAFTYGDSTTNPSLGDTRFLKIIDPLDRTTYVEYDQGVDAGDSSGGVMINPSLIPTGMNTTDEYLQYRNTFYFDPNQYALAMQGGTLNYGLATVYHWLHTGDESTTSRVLESVKKPLENRVWYNYPDQAASITFPVTSGGVVTNGADNQPTAIGRVLDNGATQLESLQYNAQGNVTVATDAVGRETTYTYAANGIDLLEVSNTTNGTDQVLETVTYNTQHEPISITGANGKVSHYLYNAAGQTTRYTDPSGHATALTYNSSGHLQSTQGAVSGDTYKLTDDNLGRIIAVTDPAGSITRFAYDAADRLTSATYPDGASAHYTYNLLDLASYTDPLGQTTRYTYDPDRELVSIEDALNKTAQLRYSPAGVLDSITDQNSHTTSWVLDPESRAVTKQYADGSSDSISYETSDSLVAQVTDALGQTTTYSYNTDNTVSTVSYIANQSTPGVVFTYDPAYLRVTSMTDGTGTTEYSYYPVSSLGANRLSSVTSPVAGSLSSTDVVTYAYDALNRVVGVNVDGEAQLIGYDAISRVTSQSNPLDSFIYSYSDATPRVTSITSNHGPTLALTYYGAQGNELLQNITASSGATQLNQFAYDVNSDNNVITFSVSSPTAEAISYSYDQDNRLKTGLIGSGTPQYQYNYDPASNLASITRNGATQDYTYSTTNEINSESYDANGSPTSLEGNTYTWDGANRILSITLSSGVTSAFTYNGLGELVQVTEQSSTGSVLANHAYLWCGVTLCLARDNTQSGSPVSTEYFPQGAIIGGVPYYYVKDGLGSVRELVTASGTVASQFGYDPYGSESTLSGTVASDIGYAGYFTPTGTDLDFALNRAYDPTDGRWLNRDPIGELGGANLYAYATGNPVNFTDPLGLFSGWGGSFGGGGASDSWEAGGGSSGGAGASGSWDSPGGAGVTAGWGSPVPPSPSPTPSPNPSPNPSPSGFCPNPGGPSLPAGLSAAAAGTAAAPSLWSAGLDGGPNSIFWSGYSQGARDIAQSLDGITLEDTPIGSALDYLSNTLGVPGLGPVWNLASGTFANNATGSAIAVILAPGPTWTNIELPTLLENGVEILFFVP